eukprot:Anaeramoba_ignava/a508483_2.p1 GENE.a508483_2~~a508483_2.p1  ORF type:complete len:102 (+),score=5.77 a508483_2:125-430(+)
MFAGICLCYTFQQEKKGKRAIMTPCIRLLKKYKTSYKIHKYEHDPSSSSYGEDTYRQNDNTVKKTQNQKKQKKHQGNKGKKNSKLNKYIKSETTEEPQKNN